LLPRYYFYVFVVPVSCTFVSMHTLFSLCLQLPSCPECNISNAIWRLSEGNTVLL